VIGGMVVSFLRTKVMTRSLVLCICWGHSYWSYPYIPLDFSTRVEDEV